jgi:putative MATE family efflux protein
MSSEQNTLARDLTVGSVPKRLLLFAAPLLASGLLQTVYNMVDAVVVGQVVGSNGLAAVSIGGDLLHTLTFVAMGFSNAGQVIISQFTGARQPEKVKRVIGALFTFLLACSLVIMGLCLVFRDPLLRLLNTPEEAWEHTVAYITPCILGLVFIYGYNLVSAVLRGMGDSRHPFLFIAVAAVLNIVLDLLFVAVFHWGAFGAALATVMGQALSFILSLVFLYRRREQFGFDFRLSSFRIHKDVFIPLIRLGIPMVLQSAAVGISRLFVNANVNAYGVVATAVSGIGSKLETAIIVIISSLTTAGSSMIGQNIGAEKYDRVPRVILVCFLFDAVVCGILIALLVLFPHAVFGLFTSEPETLDMAMTYIPVAVLNFSACIARAPMFSLINGSGNSHLNLAVALLDGVIVRIGLSLLLGETLGMGVYGYWYGCALAGFVPFFIGGAYYLSGKWRTRRYVIREEK